MVGSGPITELFQLVNRQTSSELPDGHATATCSSFTVQSGTGLVQTRWNATRITFGAGKSCQRRFCSSAFAVVELAGCRAVGFGPGRGKVFISPRLIFRHRHCIWENAAKPANGPSSFYSSTTESPRRPSTRRSMSSGIPARGRHRQKKRAAHLGTSGRTPSHGRGSRDASVLRTAHPGHVAISG